MDEENSYKELFCDFFGDEFNLIHLQSKMGLLKNNLNCDI